MTGEPAHESPGGLLRLFVAASLPAVAVGCWSLGDAMLSRLAADDGAALAGWRGAWLQSITGADGPGALTALSLGLSYLLPLLVTAGAVCLAWEALFARLRRRPIDPAWLMTAWLYTALLPASLPLPVAALGASFGTVIGGAIFGGTGRYLVSPALLGALFVSLAYPDLFAAASWLPLAGEPTTWSRLAAGGPDALADPGWLAVFSGRETAALGTASALACVLGASMLVARGAVSWRTLGGALLGVILASAALPETAGDVSIPWYWHLATGSAAFGFAFVATDPTTMPLTVPGRWLHGAAAGALLVLFRMANPEHPEGTLLALVLASLFVPLLDHLGVAWHAHAYRRRARQ